MTELEIRIIIKTINYYNITEELSDIKFNLVYKNNSQTSDVYWKYTNGLAYNWKFLLTDKESLLENQIKLIMLMKILLKIMFY